jgi:HEAT repeat protein
MKNFDLKKTLEQIEKLEKDRDIERLFEYLSSESFLIRDRACKAIAKIGKEHKNKLLSILQKGYWYEKGAVLDIFSQWGDKDYINIFIKYLKEKNLYIKEKAAYGLYRIIKNISTLPQDFDPEILKELSIIFSEIQKKEISEEIKKWYEEFKK